MSLRDELRLNSHEEEVVILAKRAIHDVLNRFTGNAGKALAHHMATDHRTLVQNAMRDFVLPFIGFLAEQGHEGHMDLRNEGSVRLAMEIQEVVDKSDNFLPFV